MKIVGDALVFADRVNTHAQRAVGAHVYAGRITTRDGVSSDFSVWANHGVGAGEGLRMLSAQAANEALRHCRIGRVTKKA